MPLVVPEFTTTGISAKPRLLICEITNDSDAILESMRAQGYSMAITKTMSPVAMPTRMLISVADIVLLDVTLSSRDTLSAVEALSKSIGVCSVRPRLLCFSTAHRNPEFVMELEKCGARYVRVSDPTMLIEAIHLLIAEMNDFQRNGPCFQIIHSFSQGTCAPGEEVSAALLENHGELFHLRLAVVERLVLDFLAEHRRIASDSAQIVSGLSGDWFYRDHAANSGHKQVKKIRKASVKVVIQRIRKAMASTFAEAGIRFDPQDVLRSCPGEGTNRVLYRLHADVRWHHVSVDPRQQS